MILYTAIYFIIPIICIKQLLLFYRKAGPAVCDRSHDVESPYYQPLNPCISGMRSQRWISIESRTPWPSRVALNSTELGIYGKYNIQPVNECICDPHVHATRACTNCVCAYKIAVTISLSSHHPFSNISLTQFLTRCTS